MPVSLLRMAPREFLGAKVMLQTTLRIDLPLHYFECGEWRYRGASASLILPQGIRDNSGILRHLKLAGGEVLQKYYDVAVPVGEALDIDYTSPSLDRNPDLSTSRTSRSIGQHFSFGKQQYLSLGLRERRLRFTDQFIQVNSLAKISDYENHEPFTGEFWLPFSGICATVVGFGICIQRGTGH